jgi:hypothetical protein
VRTPKPENQLTVGELQEIRALLGNQLLLSGLRKLWREESEFWHRMGKNEAEKPNPNVSAMVRFAAREGAAEDSEKVLWKAVGG